MNNSDTLTIKRVLPISSLTKKKKVDTTYIEQNLNNWKQVQSYLKKRTIYHDREQNFAIIDLSACSTNFEFDKGRLIQLIRACVDLINLTPEKTPSHIGFWGLADLCFLLKIRYGSRDCLDLCQVIHTLTKKHISAYLDYLKSDIDISIKVDSDLPFEDKIFYDGNVGKLKMCWVESEKYFYANDIFLNDLLLFGFTPSQVKTLIHGSQISGTIAMLPQFVLLKYFKSINAKKEIKEILENGARDKQPDTNI
jgi:hypothetical protein